MRRRQIIFYKSNKKNTCQKGDFWQVLHLCFSNSIYGSGGYQSLQEQLL